MLAALLVAAAVQVVPPGAAAPTGPAPHLAFAAQCRFASGTRILLVHRFGSDTYRFAILREAGGHELVTITPDDARGVLNIDGGRTVERVTAIDALFHWLIRRNFRVFTEEELAEEMIRTDVEACPADFRVPE
jgi:hypothetical protein